MTIALEGAGYEVTTAQNGFAALRFVSLNPDHYQLIMTDLRMPGMNGLELIEQTRLSGYLGPYIGYAGQITPDNRQRLRELRVTHILDKRVAELIGAIREVQTTF